VANQQRRAASDRNDHIISLSIETAELIGPRRGTSRNSRIRGKICVPPEHSRGGPGGTQMTAFRASARAGSALAALFALALLSSAAQAGSAPSSDPSEDYWRKPPDLSGTYWATEYRAKIEPVGGGELPLTEKGKAAYAMNMAGLKDGSIIDRARRYCTPDGLPRALATPYPFEIVQAPPGQVLIVYEMNHMIRRIALSRTLPSQQELLAYAYYNGHSVGHYEGDTLVIQSRGFKDETFLDATGAPHTDMLETRERIRKIGPTQLEDVITVHDPEYYSRDWQARFVYTLRNDVHIEDYVCGRAHRDLSAVKGVVRP
jgi:hypothetical protein